MDRNEGRAEELSLVRFTEGELSNKPLQQPNATSIRAMVTCAATPRAAPATPRGRGTLESDLGVRC